MESNHNSLFHLLYAEIFCNGAYRNSIMKVLTEIAVYLITENFCVKQMKANASFFIKTKNIQ